MPKICPELLLICEFVVETACYITLTSGYSMRLQTTVNQERTGAGECSWSGRYMRIKIGSDRGVQAATRAKLIVYVIVSSSARSTSVYGNGIEPNLVSLACSMLASLRQSAVSRTNGVDDRNLANRTLDSAPVARWRRRGARSLEGAAQVVVTSRTRRCADAAATSDSQFALHSSSATAAAPARLRLSF